jgi:hypothetical protein
MSDDEGRAIAEDIGEQRPGWLVMFGVYSRQFVAFPLFAVSRRTILAARYPDVWWIAWCERSCNGGCGRSGLSSRREKEGNTV